MDYFHRDLPNQTSLESTLKDYGLLLDKFYSNFSEKDKFIRLHSSTLGKDELLAFSQAFLEGNITLGKYNNQYEDLARNIFKSEYCVTSNSDNIPLHRAVTLVTPSRSTKVHGCSSKKVP